jgi:hypothetical protein
MNMARAFVAKGILTRAVPAGAVVAAAMAVAAVATPMASAQEPGDQRDRQQDGQPGGNVPTVSSSQIIGAQGADEWLASQLRGTAVVGADGRRIGEVVDVLLDRSGKARAFLVGVGGVAGLGAKEVAIDLSQFHEIPAPDNGARAQLRVPLTMEQLAAVPDFQALPVPDATTGTAPRP